MILSFLAVFDKIGQNLSPGRKIALLRLKSVIWEDPKKWGVKELLYSFDFLGGHFLAQKMAIFWRFSGGPK